MVDIKTIYKEQRKLYTSIDIYFRCYIQYTLENTASITLAESVGCEKYGIAYILEE